jgi:hypothetical protein
MKFVKILAFISILSATPAFAYSIRASSHSESPDFCANAFHTPWAGFLVPCHVTELTELT